MSEQTNAAAELKRYGLIRVAGADARSFLHAQLTNDVEHLDAAHARPAGWCSPKGRLLATFLVVPQGDAFLLQVSRDLAAAVAKRLGMFVLRAKAAVTDDSDQWRQYGAWGAGARTALERAGLPVPAGPLACATGGERTVIAIDVDRFLVLSRDVLADFASGTEDDWALAEIRAARPVVTQATQDQFVPQMANLEALGGVDFHKGCYPGQEIVARTQYRGLLKRRLYRVRSLSPLQAGQALYSDDFPGQASGMVVNAVGGEGLAVLQIATVENASPVRTAADGPPLEVLPPPYPLKPDPR